MPKQVIPQQTVFATTDIPISSPFINVNQEPNVDK